MGKLELALLLRGISKGRKDRRNIDIAIFCADMSSTVRLEDPE